MGSLGSSDQKAVVFALLCVAPALLILSVSPVISHLPGIEAGALVEVTYTTTAISEVQVTGTSTFVTQTNGYYTTMTTTSVSSSSTTITTQTTSSTFIPTTTTTSSTTSGSGGGVLPREGTGGGARGGSGGGGGGGGLAFIPGQSILSGLVLTGPNGEQSFVSPSAEVVYLVLLPILGAVMLWSVTKRNG